MKRLMMIVLVAAVAGQLAAPDPASAARRVRVVHRGPYHRTVVVVHRGWPLRRPLPVVVVHPVRRAVVVAPVVFLAPVVWTGRVATLPDHDRLVWEDGETLSREEGWTEFTLNADARGDALFLEVRGKAQIDFAEVVFENGDTQVVDFSQRTRGAGIYSLLDFRDGRRVSHVRMVARARSDEARLVLRMER